MPNARSVLLKFYWSLFASFCTVVLTVRCGVDPTASRTYESGSGDAATSGRPLTSNQYAVKVDYNALRNRQVKSIASVESIIEADLNSVGSQDRRFIRYFTLTNLYNGGTPDPELAAFRHGLSKMVNSLSYNRDIVPPVSVDPEQTIFRINLRDYGWSRFSWDEISRRDPYAFLTNSQAERNIRRLTGARFQAYARADWFAVNGMQAPLYHLLLDIPRNIRSLEFQLGVNVDNNIRSGQVIRGGFNGSGVSQQNRMVEWHQGRFGGYWKSYDFEPSAGRSRRNLFEFALDRRNFGGNGFDFAGGEMIFQLPNGLSGYVLTDANGNRINKAPTEIVADPTRPDMAVSNGLSCFRCHHSGMIPYREMIRDHFEQNAFAFSRREVETVKSLYAPQPEHVAKLKAYDNRFAEAVSKLGFPYAPGGGISGDSEPVYLLARNFESEIPVSMAAAELGMSVNDFQAQLTRSRFLSRRIGNLSLNGTVKREIFEDNFGFIVEQFRLGRPFFRRGSLNLTETDDVVHTPESTAASESIENQWEPGEDRRNSRTGIAVNEHQVSGAE